MWKFHTLNLEDSCFIAQHSFFMVKLPTLLLTSLLAFAPLCANAQSPLVKPDLHQATFISPYYFGPNAFPVPDMLDGTVSRDLRIELSGDHFWGFRGDHTTDIALKANIPLFSRRVNLSAWMPVTEWWRNSEENKRVCRIADSDDSNLDKGHTAGDVYLSIDMQLMTQKRYRPDWSLRATLKTASSYYYWLARYYDSPGYFFDTSFGWFIPFSSNTDHAFFRGIRLAASGGFLCWQTDNGRQNDAVMFGGLARLETRLLNLEMQLSGYTGWEHTMSHGEGAHDTPVTLKVFMNLHINPHWDVVTQFQRGINDYPYTQLKLGAAYKIDILK